MKLPAQIISILGAIGLAVSADVLPGSGVAKATKEGLKSLLSGTLEWFGGIGEFCWRLVKALVRPPYEGKELLRQMDEVGAKSLPLVALAGAAIGVSYPCTPVTA
jgi:ABC-type transporter Mla maintaining outer membrane lipid asymmetry permease subunit MlaE